MAAVAARGVQLGAFLLGLLKVPLTCAISGAGIAGRPSSLRALCQRSQSFARSTETR